MQWAQRLGPSVALVAELILADRAVDGLRPVRALIRLADTYTTERLGGRLPAGGALRHAHLPHFSFDFDEHVGSLMRACEGKFRFRDGTRKEIRRWQAAFRDRLRAHLGLAHLKAGAASADGKMTMASWGGAYGCATQKAARSVRRDRAL